MRSRLAGLWASAAAEAADLPSCSRGAGITPPCPAHTQLYVGSQQAERGHSTHEGQLEGNKDLEDAEPGAKAASSSLSRHRTMRWKWVGEADVKGPRQLERWQEPCRAESGA